MPYAPKYLAFIGSSSPCILMCSSCGRQPVEARREDTVMETEGNKEKVRRLYEEGVNQRTLAVVDEVFASDMVLRGPVFGTGELRGNDAIAAIKREFALYNRGEGRITIQEQIAEGESVATRYRLEVGREQRRAFVGVTLSLFADDGKIHEYRVVVMDEPDDIIRIRGNGHN
jgi:SnoaL-like domain